MVKKTIDMNIMLTVKKYVEEISKHYNIKEVYIFGSYAKNNPTKNSDIDILIDSKGKIRGLKFFAMVDKIREKLDKEVDVIEKLEIDKNSKIEKIGIVIYEK